MEPQEYIDFLTTLFGEITMLDADGKFYIWKCVPPHPALSPGGWGGDAP